MLGTFGSGGASLVILIALIAHRRQGKGRVKLVQEDHHVFYWCAALSLFAANAGAEVQQITGIGNTLSQAVTSQSGTLGSIGPAGVAAILLMLVFAFKPHFWRDAIGGLAAPGLLSAAGGLFALPTTIFASMLHAVVS